MSRNEMLGNLRAHPHQTLTTTPPLGIPLLLPLPLPLPWTLPLPLTLPLTLLPPLP